MVNNTHYAEVPNASTKNFLEMHLVPVIQYIRHFITLHLQVTHYVSPSHSSIFKWLCQKCRQTRFHNV